MTSTRGSCSNNSENMWRIQTPEAVSWFAIATPKGTPRDVVVKLNAELVAVLRSPEIRKSFDEQSLVAVGNTPEEAQAAIKAEVPRWEKIVKEVAAQGH